MSPRSRTAPLRRSTHTILAPGLLLALVVAACGDGGSGTDNSTATVGAGDSTAPTSTISTTSPGATTPAGNASSAPSTGTSTSGPVGSMAPTTASSPSATSEVPEGMGGSGDPGSPDDGTPDDATPDDATPDDATPDDGASSDPGTDDASDTDDGPATSGGAGGMSSTSDDAGEGGAETDGSAGAGGSDDAPSGECTRELLDGLIDDYFAALAAGDPSSLPLAASAKFTENAEETAIGTTDFWMNAGDVKHSQRALDTTACAAAVQAVVPEGTTDLPIGVRLKVEAGEITEIETIVVRQGDYTASYAVDNDPARIIAYAADIGWHDEVPEGERATREELSGWIDNYFRAFPNGVCNVSGSCRRLENGGGDFDCDGFSGCSGGGGSAMVPRLILVDEVRGIAAGLANFNYMADGHLDMHMMKMSGGEVHAVHALLRDTEGESGWD